jgi:N-acetylglucosamine repressor
MDKSSKDYDNSRALKLKILNIIRLHGSISKQSIARELFVNLTTITHLVNELKEKHKLLVETGEDVSMGGRRPKLYSINKEIGVVLGVDIGGDNIRVILIDITGNIIASITSKTDVTKDGKKLLNEVSNMINKFIVDSKVPESKIAGIGLSISGVIDPDSGKSIFCPNINGLNDFPLKAFLEEKTKLSVFVDESVRCMALAEKHYGIAKDYDNFIFVSLGKGIGIGIYANGKIYRGSTGLSGELGHITVSENGPICNCGNRGCLEAIASGPGILKRAKEGIENGIVTSIMSAINNDLSSLTVEIIAREAEKGDKYAYSLINRTGEYIGIAIAAALNLFGPELVVLGGGIANSGDIMIDAIKRTVQMRALGVITKKVKILKSLLGDNIAALGAATKFINVLFTDSKLNILNKKT